MTLSERKLSLIERLRAIEDEQTVKRYEELLVEAELISRTVESMNAIDNEQVISLDEFNATNKKWLRENRIR
jgi:hypothetical protein